MKKKVTILGFIFLALILAAMPFMAACGEEEPAPTTPTTPTTPTMGEPVYTVMDPRGTEPPREYSGINPRLDTLSGKKVIVVNLHGGNEDAIRSVAPELEAAIPDCQVSLLECEARWAVNAAEWEQIEANDAAIFGHDYWGGSSAAQARIVAEAEGRGLPSVLESWEDPAMNAIAKDTFMKSGYPACRQVLTPADTAISNLREYIPDFIDALTVPLTAEESSSGTYQAPIPPRIAITGTYDEIIEYFEGDLIVPSQISGGPWGWMTDGQPIVPPTEDRVAEMLTGTSHAPDEIVKLGGRVGADRIVTVEKVAVNAVMAGCKPEYMPGVLTIAETGACTGYPGDAIFGHMYVVSGPYAKEIGMNQGFAFLASGNPANESLKRACSLMGINLAGTKHSVSNGERMGPLYWGTTFAEATELTPWESLNVRYGYDATESIMLSYSSSFYMIPGVGSHFALATNLEELQTSSPEKLVENLKAYARGWEGATVLFTPDTAKKWKDKFGFDTMQELQEYLWDNTWWPAGQWYDEYFFKTHRHAVSVEKIEPVPGKREINKTHLNLPPDTLVPKFKTPEDIVIIVAGGSGEAFGVGFKSPKIFGIDKWR